MTVTVSRFIRTRFPKPTRAPRTPRKILSEDQSSELLAHHGASDDAGRCRSLA